MKIRMMLAVAAAALVTQSAWAESKVGFINTQRVMREAVPAVQAQKKLEKEFARRDQELQQMAKRLQTMKADFDKNSVTMSASDRRNKERDFGDLNREFQRKQREFREDLNVRQNEEMSVVLERANRTVKAIAEAEGLDIVLQDAVWASPRIDITEKVIKALADGN